MSQSSTHTQSSIARHRRSHNGDKPYTCTFCDAAYADKKRLQEHILSHTGDRPYKCKFCKFRSKRCVPPSLRSGFVPPLTRQTNSLSLQEGESPQPRAPIPPGELRGLWSRLQRSRGHEKDDSCPVRADILSSERG